MYKINPERTEEELKEYGFTNYNKPSLYFMRMLQPGISFNVTVNRKDFSKSTVDVLDENFLQPFDFEGIRTPFGIAVKSAYQKMTAKLVTDGILINNTK